MLCPVIRVLPQDAIVYLVAADHIGQQDRLSFPRVVVTVEVFDMAKTVATCAYA